jgi:hypothetical protein
MRDGAHGADAALGGLKRAGIALLLFAALGGQSMEMGSAPATGPAEDRVGLPDYSGFTHLRTFYGAQQRRVGTVYANAGAASVTDLANLPYPHGSIFVVEWRRALTDPAGAPLRDSAGSVRSAEVVQIDVMRREPGFGAAYGAVRTGDWEYVAYRPDGGHFVAPGQSSQCAACHMRASAGRDFVFRGRFPPLSEQTMGN